MKELKFAIAGLAVLGLISVFLPLVSVGDQSISLWDVRELDAGQVYLILGGFLVPLVMAGLAIAQGAMIKWQASVAAAGFALAALKARDGFEGAIGGKLMLIAAALGLVAAIVAIVKGDKAA
jgi:hypothetical protein